ncbi:MAG: UDP-N-acetylmuramate dehydrogenase [Streptosporangiaceae bacterium]
MLILRERVPLSGYTTLRLGGAAARFVEAGSAAEIAEAVGRIDAGADPLLVLGGGSNLVVADDGFPGTVLRIAGTGVSVAEDGGRVLVTAAAGENWDRLVEWSVSEKLAGIECLAGIPGLAGATPIQNVGAYGQEVAATITAVMAYDRAAASIVTLAGQECAFGYRTSVFKRTPWPAPARPAGQPPGPTGRWVVLEVTLALERDPLSVPVRYAQLAAHLGVAAGERAPLDVVRAAVLDLRGSKGMVLDPADPDTASAGSFFTNPVLSQDRMTDLGRVVAARWPGVLVPSFPAGDGQVKVPAAWLIERAGFGKGYPGEGAARISSKHTLALTNAGGASTADLLGLARQIVAGVRSAFGVELASEPTLVGAAL